MNDVAETPVLNISELGDRAYIGISLEQPLDHAWAATWSIFVLDTFAVVDDFFYRRAAGPRQNG